MFEKKNLKELTANTFDVGVYPICRNLPQRETGNFIGGFLLFCFVLFMREREKERERSMSTGIGSYADIVSILSGRVLQNGGHVARRMNFLIYA